MRVLLDENLPHDLTKVLTGHMAFTGQGLGWAGTRNGALLKRASGEYDVFVTMDGSIEHQQDFANPRSAWWSSAPRRTAWPTCSLSSMNCFRLSVAYGRVKCAA